MEMFSAKFTPLSPHFPSGASLCLNILRIATAELWTVPLYILDEVLSMTLWYKWHVIRRWGSVEYDESLLICEAISSFSRLILLVEINRHKHAFLTFFTAVSVGMDVICAGTESY